MPGFTVTRGLGPRATPSALIVRGFITEEVVELLRGGARTARKFVGDLLEEIKISASLVAINGKDLVNPIINIVRKSYADEPTPEIRVTPTKLTVKQPDIKVKAMKVRNKNVNN
jgi:hypothetical protein